MRASFLLFLFFVTILPHFGCKESKKLNPVQKLFMLMSPKQTGIDFNNELKYDEEFNVYTYKNFYNGGGVALGDINNDGLTDIFFTGNQVSNRLYLNTGGFKFKDITSQAGLSSQGIWSTGATMADINGDGLLDLYVCKSGYIKGEKRYNELFINNGNLTFSEKAKEFGIADVGLSTHAVFFDYDKDNDLDCYLLNNSVRSVGGYDLRKDQRNIRDTLGGNKLYRNEGNFFTDISEKAGIYGSSIGFGLGVTVGDVNKDGWQDIFISNDFFERDYLYINNKKGGFEESLESCMREISMGSMGADMADINNDGYPEIFVTEMLPVTEARLKTKASFENWDKHLTDVKNGYYYQYPRNVLQLNNQNNTFSEIGRFAGVAATDWSWGALIFDMDNDGFKDIFVANGIYKDLLDQDYINFMADPSTVKEILKKEKSVIKKLVDMMPSEALPNCAFKNNGDLTFKDKAGEWGLASPGFSNGSAYADLDNDGDLDLVVNNVNMPAFVYQNRTETLNNSYLKIKLAGEGKNSFALGAQVSIISGSQLFYQEQIPMKGFESSVDHVLNFGLGKIKIIDSLKVLWPDGKTTVLTNLKPNQTIILSQKEAFSATLAKNTSLKETKLFNEIPGAFNLNFKQKENDFIDFDRDRLTFHMLSAEGPKITKGDVNKDGLDDFYIGGAKDSPGALFIQQVNGKFKQSNQDVFEKDKISEDQESIFFDCDNDGDQDLFVCSGGNEFPSSSSALKDRLYINNGKGNFSKSPQALPTLYESSSCVAASDFDNDSDLDLFVGVRLQPFEYGLPVNGYLLENDGKGNFKDVTLERGPALKKTGMITSALWVDYDLDKDEDLVVTGEYMPVKIFRNDGGKFRDFTKEAGMEKTAGWWNCVISTDVNGDGKPDLIAGNHGLNSRFKASVYKPLTMYVKDFDGNGSLEQIITVFNGDKSYPMVLRNDLVMQLPSLKKKYLKFDSYKEKGIEEIFTPVQLKGATILEANVMESSLFLNKGDGTFQVKSLPSEAQLSPVYSIVAEDFDKDGEMDLLMGGNFYRAKPEVGRYDASYGLFLKGSKGGFVAVSSKNCGFQVKGEIRSLNKLKVKNENIILVGKNGDAIQAYKY